MCGREWPEAGTSGRVQGRHDQTELDHVSSSQEAKDTRAVTKMSGLYREEPLGEGQPSPWAGKFRLEGSMCQPYPVTGRD